MNELIAIEERDGVQTVNARTLWENLESKQEFAHWIKSRLEGFLGGVDYILDKTIKVQNEGGRSVSRPVVDYHLTLDTAKHLAMLEHNSRGRVMRAYFIEVEKRARAAPQAVPQGPELLALAVLEANRMIEAKNLLIEELRPRAAIADRIGNAEGLKTLTEVGKINGIGPRKIFPILHGLRILYRMRGVWVPYQEFIDADYFRLKEAIYQNLDEVEHLKTQTYVTGKGEVWLARQLFPSLVVV